MSDTQGLRIVALQAENVKRLKAVRITPAGAVVEITGKNGNGKTSVLDAIWWAIEGTTHIQAEPIRRGADEAFIKLDLGKLKVTRKFKRRSAEDGGGHITSLSVENEEGARFGSPQAMLDAMVGELSFDPLAFSRMKAADQFDVCRRFVPGVDFDALAKADKDDYAERTATNKRAKELRAQAEGIVLGQTMTEGVRDESALVAQLQQAGETNADIERRRGNREKAEAEIAENVRFKQRLLTDAADLEAQAKAKREHAERVEAQAEELRAKLAAAGELPAPIATADITAAIEEARAHNKKVEAHIAAAKSKGEFERQAKAADEKSRALTKQMEERAQQKQKAIAAAKMPVAGLSFGEASVLLDGLPFDQASDAQQLAASVAIAAAMNPKLRVIRVRDGSLLDQDSMTLLGQFAEAHDLQVWVETVASGRPGAVVIEDGEVRADDKTEAA